VSVELRAVAYDHPDAVRLIEAMGHELSLRYGDGGLSPASPADFLPPGVLLVAALDGVPVGCGGIRPYGQDEGELKRMYVDPTVRGKGVGRTLLAALVAHARGAGMRRLLLETGTEQPEAVGLYESEGWTPVPAFGHYADDPRTRCYGLELL
jgi:GNAT superfamily N-acetyltransferase